ncbi:hypothetical protein HUN08_01315 [Gordonia sp. X0973]|uniref:hypothetical protein n=1 Tax=Gordonia sp. X0973 TaxID=2742602 RepID=UPI000F53BF66|nr:hypothetical protein [Gordonia sp. X0973]QKT05980.1 hypothetical protein HUN08_01315 [Gordonia sp. X0973]
MFTTKLVASVAGAAALAAVSLVGSPANAASATFTTNQGRIIAKVTGLPLVPKTCSLYRQTKVGIDGWLSTYSADTNKMKAAEAKVNGSSVTLTSPKLPHDWYDVVVYCSASKDNMMLFTRDGRVRT